jgi:hypothetical protein
MQKRRARSPEAATKHGTSRGWNPLLLKVTQLNQGWAFCARFVKPDGSHLDGLQFAAEPPKDAAASAGK